MAASKCPRASFKPNTPGSLGFFEGAPKFSEQHNCCVKINVNCFETFWNIFSCGDENAGVYRQSSPSTMRLTNLTTPNFMLTTILKLGNTGPIAVKYTLAKKALSCVDRKSRL